MECRTPQSPSSNPQTQALLQNPANHVKQTAMEAFQKAVFNLVETQPNTPLTPAGRTLLQDRLNQFVSRYKTPDHPPYSAMIDKALRELNEKRGSSEDSISQFLKKEYENLPWSHSALLNHHLSKLCDSGDIIATRKNKYMLPGQNPNLKSTTKVKRKPQRRRLKWDWERERNKRRQRVKKGKCGKAGVSAKHEEPNEEEEPKMKENEEEEQKVGVSANHQETNKEEEQKIKENEEEVQKAGVSVKHQEFNEEEEQKIKENKEKEQKVGVSAKHQESKEEEEKKIKENEEEEQIIGVSAKHQESIGEEEQKIGVFAKDQESKEEEQKIKENGMWIPLDEEEHNLSSPERTPGFEFVRADNLSPNLDKMEVEIVSGEEFAKSERGLRQKRRWTWKLPVKLENRPKLEEKKDLPFSKERKPRKRRRGGPNFESFLDLLGPEYDLPKRANKKQKPIKLEYTNKSDHEVEEKQVRKRGRPSEWRKRKQEPDAIDVENDEESRQDCEKMEAPKTEERPRARMRHIGRTPKRRSPRLQKLE